MFIKKMIGQHRRDFWADYECESCGHIQKNRRGYDDLNFHENVIPQMKCEKCGESSASSGAEYRPRATRYPEGYQV